jgi:DNA-binding transcriptional LysR family regulator
VDFLRRVESFVQVADAGSLSRAARSLRVSVPAISRQIAALESELGARLLVRTTRSLRLTDEGQLFRQRAIRLLSEAAEARASVRPELAMAGRLVVSASVTLGVLRLVPELPALFAKHPGLRLELRLEDRSVDIAAEGIDVAVRGGRAPPDTASLVARALATYRCFVVASETYLRERGAPRTLGQLANHAAIVGTSSPSTWTFIRNEKPIAVPIRPVLRVGTVLGIRAAAIAGLGLAVLPHFAIADDLEAGRLRAILPGASLAPMPVCAIYRAELRGSAKVDGFVAYLRATLPTVPLRTTNPSALGSRDAR